MRSYQGSYHGVRENVGRFCLHALTRRVSISKSCCDHENENLRRKYMCQKDLSNRSNDEKIVRLLYVIDAYCLNSKIKCC